MKALLTVFLISAVCGLIMWVVLRNYRKGYKGIYALYLAILTGIGGSLAFGFRSLWALGIALIAYTILIGVKNAAPASVFCLPSVWLTAFGGYLIGKSITNGSFSLINTLLFGVVAFLAILYPFMDSIQYGLDGEEDKDNFELRKNRNFAWAGLVMGLLAAIVFIYIH